MGIIALWWEINASCESGDFALYAGIAVNSLWPEARSPDKRPVRSWKGCKHVLEGCIATGTVNEEVPVVLEPRFDSAVGKLGFLLSLR